MVMLRKEFCVEEEEIGDKLKEIWEMYGDNAESMQLTVVGLLRPRILVDIVEIEDQSHLKYKFYVYLGGCELYGFLLLVQ